MVALGSYFEAGTEMKELFVRAFVAYQTTTGEAGATQYVGKEHLVIEVCSLEKKFRYTEAKLKPKVHQALQI
jgi:hypothetical protein